MGGTIDKLLDGVPVPKVVRVRQSFPDEHIPVDRLPQDILERVRARGAEERIRPGMRIGITAGSRSVSNIPLILKTLVDLVRERGAEPFLIAAMGSHGGATSISRTPQRTASSSPCS